ncbi:MAG: hypothetical protein ACFFBD_27445 [Candidatus Hodarchaeota archaeon]
MTNKQDNALTQLKINYIKMMEQATFFSGIHSNLKGILAALLIENDYLTQEQLMELTGYSRKVVSETLTELTEDINWSFHVLKTRKAGDAKNYYIYTLSFEQHVKQHIKSVFTESLKRTQMNLHFLPLLIQHLDCLTPQNDDILHVRKVLSLSLTASKYYSIFIEQTTEETLMDFFKDPRHPPSFLQHIEDFFPAVNEKQALEKQASAQKSKDSLQQIKKESISMMLQLSSSLNVNKETAVFAILILLYLEKNPATQDIIKKLTGYGRSTISESINSLIKSKFVKTIKKPGDRKKYYSPTLTQAEFASLKWIRMQQGVYQLKQIIENSLLPSLEKIEGSKEEKNNLQRFLKENIRAYDLLGNYLDFMNSFFSKVLNKMGSY